MLWNWIWQHDGFGDFAFHCTWIAALASVFVSASGWFFAESNSSASNELFLHRWFGIGSSAGLIALAFMTSLVRSDSWPGLLKISRFASLLVAAGIGITAHFGGEMVWGEGQVTTPLSNALSVSWASIRGKDAEVATAPIAPTVPTAPLTTAPSTTAPTTPVAPVAPTAPATPATTDAPKPIANTSIHDVLRMSLAFAISATQTTPPATTPPADSSKSTVTPPATTPPAIPKDLEYNKNILPILEARCWDCHGKGVAKGGVAFDHVAELIVKEPLVKSKQLPIILVGKPGSSAMMKAIQKPMTAKGHMPPKGARLTAEQIALIEAWIQQGAKVVNP
jgi:mono/diheme cytochrome c family protein